MDPGSSVPVGSAGPEGSGAPRPEEQGQMWEETLVRAFPLDFSRTVGLKSGQISCTVQGIQVLDNVSGLPRENFETWPTVETVDGETADEGNQEWWCLTKGGEMWNYGVDDTQIEDGDAFEFTLTVGY